MLEKTRQAPPGVHKTPGRRGLGVGSAGGEGAQATTCLLSFTAKQCMRHTKRNQLPGRRAIKHKPKHKIGRPMIDKSTQTRWLLHHAVRVWTPMRKSSAVALLSTSQVLNVSRREQSSRDSASNEVLKKTSLVRTHTAHLGSWVCNQVAVPCHALPIPPLL